MADPTLTQTSSVAPDSPWRIGVDVGGTFTDLVLVDHRGQSWVAKVPSVPSDPSVGVTNALNQIASDLDLSPQSVLEQCELFVHGSTVATNTMLEGKGAKVGLLTTEGFRDSLEIRRGLREDQWDHRRPYAPVLVPRYLRHGIPERIDPDGSEHQALDLTGLGDIVEIFRQEDVEAVAVAFLNSYRNPDHELATAAALADQWDGEWVVTSAGCSPLMGEYERTSTAVVNASLLPRIVGYLRNLAANLQENGLARPVLMVQSNGGVASIEQVANRPVNLLLSGPAAVVGALRRYAEVAGTSNLISMEIGGTSCDVLLMADGIVATRDDLDIAGYHVSTPAIDIHTIGAGGGTLAGVDDAGMLYVGPQGAGADPGPACYGRGGTRPTVTDAHLVLGRLASGASPGGTLNLDLAAARAAIDQYVAQPLGMAVEQAAAGIVEVVEQHLLGAVQHLSIERGYAPRDFTLVAAGGAGPMHGAAVGAGLGCQQVFVPRNAGALCAMGMLDTDVRHDFTQVVVGSLAELPDDTILEAFTSITGQAETVMQQEGFSADQVRWVHEIELHHPGQLWAVKVPLGNVTVDGFQRDQARARFESEYQRLYGHVQTDSTILVASVRVTASASTGERTIADAHTAHTPPVPTSTRSVWFPHNHAPGVTTAGVATAVGSWAVDAAANGGSQWYEASVYDGAQLRAGHRITGPALIEEHTTTVVVRPGDQLEVLASGDFLMNLAAPEIEVETQASADADGEADGPVARIASGSATGTATSDGRGPAYTSGVLDPVTLALLQNRLDQITRHMGWVMTRTARSTIFSQSHDFSCFIATPEGTLVANADGIPIHTGGGGFAVRALLDRFGDRLQPGDVYLLSDPYVAGGNHLPDWVIARPVYVDTASGPNLIGFCCNRAHQSDIGGGLAGTYNPEATEIWQEGIRLPVLRLVEAGHLRDDLYELLMINCRTPELLDGDLLAMMGSTRIGAERVAELASELGVDGYFAHLDGVLGHADARMRAAIAALPDGTYQGEDFSDNDCFGPADIRVRVTATVTGDEITFDFTESSPQITGFKNSSVANTYSSVFLAMSSFFDPSIPRNEGTYRCATIVAPEGTIVNARPPAPMTMNTVFVAHEIVIAVWQALAQAAPDRACAAWSKTMHGHVAGTAADGTTWVMYHWHAMGTPGATAERDGFAQMGHLITLGGLDIPNLEFHEQRFPVRYHHYEQLTDRAGPGANRGGTGIRYEADVLEPAIWSFRAEGLHSPSGHGVEGGGTGGVGYEWVRPIGEAEFEVPKYGVKRLGPARMTAETPGGGGWGDPFTRDPERVLRDVRDGVVSSEAAAKHYGVVLTPDGRAVDVAATAERRARS